MNDGFCFGDLAEAVVVPGHDPADMIGYETASEPEARASAHSKLHFQGVYHVECYDADGDLKWEDVAHNSITNVGMNLALNNTLNNATPSVTWYIGLVDNSGFSAFAAADTMASHAGWTENQAYTQANRVAWGNGSASGQSMTNASTANFSINATVTIKGLFLVDNNTKGGTTGNLFSEAAFAGGNQAAGNGDTLKITYTVSAATS